MTPAPNDGSEMTVNPPPNKTFLGGDYEYCKERITLLVNSWDFEFKATDYRRRARNITVNVADLRVQGKLKPDETIIPIRMIDTNIKREEPSKIAYLKQSRRLAIFKPHNTAKTLNVQLLESEFTRVCQYEGWETDYIKVIDGAASHGWDAVEVCFDKDKPGFFSLDHVGHENLIFPLDAKTLEASEFIIRIHQVTVSQLRSFTKKYGFDEKAAEDIIQSTQPVRLSGTISTQSVPVQDSLREIYKIWFKADGVVYVAWYGKECNNWLLPPAKLFMGIKKLETTFVDTPTTLKTGVDQLGRDVMETINIPIPQQQWVEVEEKEYPIKQLFYEENEQPQIKDRKGRVYKDDYKQEAALAMWSSFVNGCIRASNVHAAPKNPSTGAAPKQTNVIIEHGKLWTEPVDFFNTPWPDPMILSAINALDVQNTQETLQLSYAVSNRKDSRKTAKEIDAVTREQSLVSGVQVTLLSMFLRQVYSYVWRIVQSVSLQGLIVFCPVEQVPGSEQYINNSQIIGEDYSVLAAGDVDVVERAEKIQKMIQVWPLIATTPLAQEFLLDFIKLLFPDESIRYEQILRSGMILQQQQQMMQEQQAQDMMQKGMMAKMLDAYVKMQKEISIANKNNADAEAILNPPQELEQPGD